MEKLIEFSNKKKVKIYVNTKWLFLNTMGNNMNASDILIKINAIDCYFGNNNDGMYLYNKMQKIRVDQNNKIEREKAYNEKSFVDLIESFKNKGFDKNFPIELNKNFEVFEGSHRLACALYFGIEEVPVKFNKFYWDLTYDYSPAWFKKNNLNEYLPIIKKIYQKYK